MKSTEIRKRFLDFFAKRGHAILPSASLVPQNDPSVLFNTAGMQPLVPYLMGEPHPLGDKIVSCQKCVRTGDIDEIGDNTHNTFFEMLGNWSLGSYFKEDAIKYSFEFLTSKDEGLGLDPARLYVTLFEGNSDAPKDVESFEIWKKYIPESRIFYLGWNGKKEPNWWDAGDNGPSGPDTEMFYDITPNGLGELTKEQYLEADDKQQVVEIWNNVFMEYMKENGAVIGKLKNKNVDTGSGFERIVMTVQRKDNIYDTDIFATSMDFIKMNTRKPEFSVRAARIICDHIRAATFLIADGVVPSNKDQGYILRRLIRRAVVQADTLGLTQGILITLRSFFATQFKEQYPELDNENGAQHDVFKTELEKFQKTLESGLKEFQKGTDPFILATTYGFPIEVTQEIALSQSKTIDRRDFDAKMKAHQDSSRSGSEQKFKGGLAGTTEQTTKLHTAHHLLLKALQEIVSPDIHQKGSNITDERLRIDFNFDRKLTDEEKSSVEQKVHEWIQADLKVVKRDIPKSEAETIGAEMEFGTTYPDIVSVYFIEDANGTAISKEFCGGPHVEHTGVLGTFKIQKEEASSAGVRRIKAILL